MSLRPGSTLSLDRGDIVISSTRYEWGAVGLILRADSSRAEGRYYDARKGMFSPFRDIFISDVEIIGWIDLDAPGDYFDPLPRIILEKSLFDLTLDPAIG